MLLRRSSLSRPAPGHEKTPRREGWPRDQGSDQRGWPRSRDDVYMASILADDALGHRQRPGPEVVERDRVAGQVGQQALLEQPVEEGVGGGRGERGLTAAQVGV